MRQRNGKTEIWNLFKGRRGWKVITYVEADHVLGRAIIRYWEDKGWLCVSREEGYYVTLTEEGKTNLYKGLRSIINKSPERIDELLYVKVDDKTLLS
jgi:hypothetical protein